MFSAWLSVLLCLMFLSIFALAIYITLLCDQVITVLISALMLLWGMDPSLFSYNLQAIYLIRHFGCDFIFQIKEYSITWHSQQRHFQWPTDLQLQQIVCLTIVLNFLHLNNNGSWCMYLYTKRKCTSRVPLLNFLDSKKLDRGCPNGTNTVPVPVSAKLLSYRNYTVP